MYACWDVLAYVYMCECVCMIGLCITRSRFILAKIRHQRESTIHDSYRVVKYYYGVE